MTKTVKSLYGKMPAWAKNMAKMFGNGILDWKDKKELLGYISKSTNKKIYLFSVCQHGNIGDQLILQAEIEYLGRVCPNHSVVLVPGRFTNGFISSLSKFVKDDDLVAIHGGGFVGTLYTDHYPETLLRFNKQNIIVFPQTVFYDDTERGKEKLKKEIPLFKNNGLTLFVREKNSLDFVQGMMSKEGEIHCVLVPDIVLSYKTDISYNPEQKVVCCFRNDKEKVRSNELTENLYSIFKKNKMSVEITDMMAECNSIKTEVSRINHINSKIEQLSRGKFVITDRLHCMIICVLTGTPCIAMDNSSGKVKGVYEKWLKQLDYIFFFETAEQVFQKTEELCKMERIQTGRYNPRDLEREFEPLKTAIQNWAENVK